MASSASATAVFASISPLTLVLPLFLLLCHAAVTLGQHQSFGDTKFDLPADLPPEDVLPPVANSQDAAPSTAEPPTPPSAPATDAVPPPPLPSPSAVPQTVEAAPLPLPTALTPSPLPPSAAITEVSASTSAPPTAPTSVAPVATGGSNDSGTPNSKTPLPSLPSLIELPNFVENGNVQPLTIPPALVEDNGTTNAAASSSVPPPPVPSAAPGGSPPLQKVPLAKVPPLRSGVGAGTAAKPHKQQTPKDGQKIVVRSKEWFREEFDVRNCPKSADALTKAIRAKFPRNLLRHGKDAVLAELLGTRMAECLRKHSENHWTKLHKQLKQHDKELDKNERDECRAGLVEEQIACMNIHSFTCQFVQPSYLFRLLPTRIIVQEGRIAEEGAEKCQKFARKFLIQI